MILSSFSKSFKSFSKIQHNKHKFYSTMNKNMMKAICLKEFGGVDQMFVNIIMYYLILFLTKLQSI